MAVREDNKSEHAAALATCIELRGRDAIPQEVAPGLFIGSVGAARNREALDAAGITHVICACVEARPLFDDFDYLHVEIRDESGVQISAHFDETYAFIEEALASGGAVLVHCVLGRSRSATLIAAYLMRKEGIPMLSALDRIRAVRPAVAPNPSFALQLLRLEQKLGTPAATAAAPAADAGEQPLTWWGLAKLVLTMAPVVLAMLTALPTLAWMPPLPSYEEVVSAAESGQLPVREIIAAFLTLAVVLATGMLAERVWQKGRAVARLG